MWEVIACLETRLHVTKGWALLCVMYIRTVHTERCELDIPVFSAPATHRRIRRYVYTVHASAFNRMFTNTMLEIFPELSTGIF